LQEVFWFRLHKKTSMVEKSHYKMRLPQWAKDLRQSPSDFEVKRQVEEIDHVLCFKCGGTGKISKRCQCGGTGKTLDRKESELQGVPVYKVCKRCEGRGYSRPKSSNAYRVCSLSCLVCQNEPGDTAGNLSMKVWLQNALRKRVIPTHNLNV
jgi:hypothetical protein